MGLDAITRIVGFFVSAMGVALIFDGVIEALESHGVTTLALSPSAAECPLMTQSGHP